MDGKLIGSFLQKLRKEHQLTQKDVAKLCHVSNQAVSKWEKGDSIPDIGTLETLSILYKVSINEIVAGEKKIVHMDLNRRKAIISVFLAAFAFLPFLFVYTVVDINLGDFIEGGFFDGQIQNITVRGHELVFSGTSGLIVWLAWTQFFLYSINLVLVLFALTGVIRRTVRLNRIVFGMHALLIAVAFFTQLAELFTPTTQSILLLVSTLTILFLPESYDEKGLATTIRKTTEDISTFRKNPKPFITGGKTRKTASYRGYLIISVLLVTLWTAFALISFAAFIALRIGQDFLLFLYTGVIAFLALVSLRYLKTQMGPNLRYLYAFLAFVLATSLLMLEFHLLDRYGSAKFFFLIVILILYGLMGMVLFFGNKHRQNITP